MKFSVIGGGNGGQSIAGHLGIMGYGVTLYDIIPETVDIINRQGGIEIDGIIQGFGNVRATMDMKEAVADSDFIIVTVPAFVHELIAKQLAKIVQKNQVVLLHPGSTGGALEIAKIFNEKGVSEVAISESHSLLYACRLKEPGKTTIFGVKQKLGIATLPASRNKDIVDTLHSVFPEVVAYSNVLETSLNNLNVIMHPAPTLLSISLIESDRKWNYYYDGITPSIGKLVEKLDRERIEICKAYNVATTTVREMYKILYSATGKDLTEIVKNTTAYSGVKGQTSINTRYLTEDVPYGCVPVYLLAQIAGVATPVLKLLIDLSSQILDEDFMDKGRTVVKLGIDGMDKHTLLAYVSK